MNTILTRIKKQLEADMLHMLIGTRLENDRIIVHTIYQELISIVDRMRKEQNIVKLPLKIEGQGKE